MTYIIDKKSIESLRGKRILFFAPAFFGYENKIAEKMRAMGAEVDYFDERSITSSFNRALLKISPSVFSVKTTKYYRNIINKHKDKIYDFIFVIKGDMIPPKILKEFRAHYPCAKLCLYLYDSVANIKGIEKKFQFFDSCHSFDPDDCKHYDQLKFKPLFFCDQFRKPVKLDREYVYDICFLGTIHSDRYQIIKEVQNISSDLNLRQKWFLYLQSNFIYYFYRFTKKEFKGTNHDDFDFIKMNSEEIASIVDESNVILDIQHPKQRGLTMRTIEMLGMNKKIITTNSTISSYDFYNPNNILIIERNNISIEKKFMDSSYQRIDDSIYESYSLESWVKTVLS